MPKPKLDILLTGNTINVIPTGKKFLPSNQESDFIQQEVSKRKGGFNSIIPNLQKITQKHWIIPTSLSEVETYSTTISLGYMDYNTTYGMLQAIKTGQPSARDFVPNFSVAAVPITQDGAIVFSRRDLDASHVPGSWDLPGSGYVTSYHIEPNEKCCDESLASDGKLYNLKFQLGKKLEKEFGLSQDNMPPIMFNHIGIDYWQCFEPEAGSVVYLPLHSSQLDSKKYNFVSVSDLEKLLVNQSRSLNADHSKHSPKNDADIYVHGLVLCQLLGGYKDITQEELDPSVINSLTEGGWRINIMEPKNRRSISVDGYLHL